MMQADAFSLQPLSRILTFNGFGATKVDCLNESARTRKIKKHYFFQSSVYRICLSCQTSCCMHFDVKNKNIIY